MVKYSDPGATRRTILITGATSGIGQATARLLACDGHRVFGIGRNRRSNEIDEVELLPLEVTSNDSVVVCIEKGMRPTNRQLDVLVNNVGTGIGAEGRELVSVRRASSRLGDDAIYTACAMAKRPYNIPNVEVADWYAAQIT